MKFKLNPLTGEFDYTSDSANKEKLNPMTGEFNLVEGDGPFSQIFNPLTGTFNLGTRGGGGIITEVTGNGYIDLTNAVAHRLMELKAYGGTEQRNLPNGYTQINYVTNNAKTWLDTGLKFDFSKNYEIEIRARGTLGSWYMFQAREAASAPTHGISGSSTGDTIIFGFGGSSINTSQISRITGNIYYIKCTANNGNLTLYVKNETAGTEETVTGTYTLSTGTSVNIGLFGNGQTGAGGSQGVAPNTDVYYARIKENDTYIIDYVPCKQNTTAGVYDKVSGTFKTTTDLAAGADVVAPSPAIPMDIVCNNGVIKVSKNLFDYRYFYDNYQEYSTSSVGRCPIKLKPNTTYTISTNTEAGTTSARVFVVVGNSIDWTPNTTNNGVLVERPRTITTDSNGYLCLGIYVKSDNAIPESDFENGTVWVQFEQGTTATSYMPYGQIYTDGTAETIQAIGKNLFDSQWQSGIYNTTSGAYTPTANRICNTNMIQVKPSTNYTVSCPSYELQNGMRWLFYDANKNFISALTNGATTVATPSKAKYINFYIANNLTVGTAPDLQLEEGSTATDYKPYFNGGTATAEMLLAIGDYKDEQEILSGNITRNVGIKVLDGTEGWIKSGLSTMYYRFLIPNATSKWGTRISSQCYCTHVQGVAGTPNSYNQCGFSADFVFNIGQDENKTPAQFKQWLADQYAAGTPVIVVYPLAEPTTETVAGQTMDIQAGTNTIEITQASIDDLPLYAKYLSTNNS